MDRQITPPKRVASPIWGAPPPCKQALRPMPIELSGYKPVSSKRWWTWRVISIIAENKPHAYHETHLHTMKLVTILTLSFHGLRSERLGLGLFTSWSRFLKKLLFVTNFAQKIKKTKPFFYPPPLIDLKQKYSGTPLYGHPLNTDTRFIRTVSFVPTKSSYIFSKINPLYTDTG